MLTTIAKNRPMYDVLVLLLNREVVQEQFELSSFETLASRVRYALQSES